MRLGLVGAALLAVVLSPATLARAETVPIGFPPDAFAQAWTSLPTGRFAPVAPTSAPVKGYAALPAVIDDAKADWLVEDALASAAGSKERQEIALDEMTTAWPRAQQSAVQTLREDQAAYAGDDGARRARFASLLSRVADGTGRSAASGDDAAGAALDAAYAAALSRADVAARAEIVARQKAFVAYRDAFVAFADTRSQGMGASVAAELDRQRTADLAVGE